MKELRKILLADPNAADRAETVRILRAAGAKAAIIEAGTSADAAQSLEAGVGAALIELEFPDGDGIDLIRGARTSGITCPIIVLTAHGGEQAAVDIMKAGASDYLSKDRLTTDSLQRSLNSALRVHRAEAFAERAGSSMRESESRFRIMADSAPVLIWMSDPNKEYSFFNAVWLEFTGRTLEKEVVFGWREGLHPQDRAAAVQTYDKSFDAREPFEMEFRLCRHDGEYRWILDRGTPRFDSTGVFAGFIGSCIDITERKLAEEELIRSQAAIAALNERLRRAMRETHHRVKNNLQVVAAMVDMKASAPSGMIPVEALKELKNHIHMLTVVHEVLTQEARKDGQAETVSAETVLGRLIPAIEQIAPSRTMTFTIDDAVLSAKQGASLAIVLNELVSNSVKYGKDVIDVRLKSQDHCAVLEVSDDGPGFPEDFDPRGGTSAGLDLVESLTRWDLGGTVEYGNQPSGGGVVRVSIPLPQV